jgi:hypothetical protein
VHTSDYSSILDCIYRHRHNLKLKTAINKKSNERKGDLIENMRKHVLYLSPKASQSLPSIGQHHNQTQNEVYEKSILNRNIE